MLKQKLTSALLALTLAVSLTACGNSKPENSAESIETPEVTGEEESGEEAEFAIDWDTLSADFKEDILSNHEYAEDAYAGIGSNGYIQITAVVKDSTEPETVLDFADTLLRKLNSIAMLQDRNISSGTKDSFGGLYDVYGVQIGIAPASKTNDAKEWFIFDAIAPGVQCKHEIKLQSE